MSIAQALERDAVLTPARLGQHRSIGFQAANDNRMQKKETQTMTAQIEERLRYQGEDMDMCTTPLCHYFAMAGITPPFAANCSALWRGYIGSWDIVDDRLYLVGLEGTLQDGTDASLASFFPGCSDRVFAHWYSGTIRVPQGKELEYVHMGYCSVFERDLLLDVEQGVVVASRVRHNGAAKSDDAPDAYWLAAMTVFGRASNNSGRAK